MEVFARIPVNAGVPQGSIIGPSPFLLMINDLPVDIICIIAVYADDSTLYSKYKQVSDLWQQLDVASELKSDLQGTIDWGRKWLVDVNTGKTQLVLFYQSNNSAAIDVKINRSFLEENVCLICLDYLPFRVWIGALTLSLLLKLSPRKLEP